VRHSPSRQQTPTPQPRSVSLTLLPPRGSVPPRRRRTTRRP